MIGYSGIYSPNNKKNQESIAIRLVYSQNSENRESRNYKCMAFSGFSLPNCDLCPSPMIKYSFFKASIFLKWHLNKILNAMMEINTPSNT